MEASCYTINDPLNDPKSRNNNGKFHEKDSVEVEGTRISLFRKSCIRINIA